MKVLELYCGTKSIGKEMERLGAEVVSVDIDARFEPTICADILELSINQILAHGPFDVFWASIPCEGFSVAAIGKNWNRDHTPKSESAWRSLRLLDKTLAVRRAVNAQVDWFENPRGKMRKMPQMAEFLRYTVTYCRYGDTRMKPTDIWTNVLWNPRPMCKNGDSCHESAPRGSKTGTQGIKGARDRSIIPVELCREIAEHSQAFVAMRKAA